MLSQIRGAWPKVRMILRADSCFCREELMSLSEASGVDDVLGMARNERLRRIVEKPMRKAKHLQLRTGAAARVPVANIGALHAGRIDIAIVQSDVLTDAIRREGPFASQGPNNELRVLLTGQTEAFTIVARRKLDVRDATQLRGKRINLGDLRIGRAGEYESSDGSARILADRFRRSWRTASCAAIRCLLRARAGRNCLHGGSSEYVTGATAGDLLHAFRTRGGAGT